MQKMYMFIEKLILFAIRVKLFILKRCWNYSGRIYLKAIGVITAGPPMLYGYPVITLKPKSKIILGEGVVLCSDSRFTDLGVCRPVVIRTLRPGALVSIGNNTGLSGVAVCAAISVEIGSECLLGADVQIFDTDFHQVAANNRRFNKSPENVKCAPVIIENNVFIGAGSKIMKGVKIGSNSVIGAGSVVTRDIPENSIAAGNPARVLGRVC
ncbi:acyltransferase [Methylomonas sp. OY6]|uniref:Acyltransferase n=1 Tax=Methylomonas defluvii TaxID=3045149 RepID=A0ABU4UCH6_9GAMM|nr:acyltransferase [Methylomonas sp. OY6]MDX8127148.1 acyltransferase [Methylomonas sp. OY6]